MKPSPKAVSISPDRLFQLNELTHQLSNTVGMTVNYLLIASIGPSDAAFDDVTTAMELATKATSTLKMLMWHLGEIHRLAGLPDSLVGGNDGQRTDPREGFAQIRGGGHRSPPK